MHPITGEPKESKRRPLVTLTAREATAAINESFQTPGRVESYVATQDLVVPKDVLFDKIVEVLMNETASARRSIRILEPGMGPAAFTRFVLRQPFLDRFDDISVQGADISHGMLVYATEVIHALYQSNINGQRVTIALSSGINCINASDPFYGEIRSQGKRFDAIVASQFEHYCPNSHQSPLACKYRELGVPYSTKTEFRRLCHELLEDGGAYFTIDDRLGESPEEQEKICRAWDGHVVRQFTDDAVLGRLQASHPALVWNLQLNYDRRRPREALLHVAAKARERRRETCCEEIEPLSVTRRDFVALFGEENVFCMMHPSLETHPGFYLMWAFKKN